MCMSTARQNGTDKTIMGNSATKITSIAQESVLEYERALLSRRPTALPIKVEVDALLIVIGDDLRFTCSLKPSQVLLMKSPGLFLQLLSGQILHIGSRTVIEDVEECVDIVLGEKGRIAELGQG